jgi:predicted nucleic acid-binding protein
MALIVLDASIIIAQTDRNDAHHAAVRAALRERRDDTLRVPASAYAEALVIPARAGALGAARAALQALGIVVTPIDESVAERSASLRAETPSLRFGDALVLGSGYELGADEILTADRRWARFERVTVLG